MLKVHDEEDIEMKQGLVEALDSIRKTLSPIEAQTSVRMSSHSLRPQGGNVSAVALFRQATVESMKEVQSKILVVQETVRLKHKESTSKLQGWIKMLQGANATLESSIVAYEKTHMQVRMHYSIYLNLIEAKITTMSSDGVAYNPYVEIWIDHSRRARTRAIWFDNTPVWNQNFDVMVPQDAEELTFKLFSESKDGLADPVFLGKVDLAVENYKSRPIATEWVPFLCRGIGAVTEASSLHAIVKYKPGHTPAHGNLTVIVVEAKKLVDDGAELPSPYCRMSVIDQGANKSSSASSSLDSASELLLTPSKKDKKDKSSSAKAEKVQKSTVIKKNESPHWEEGFIFKFRWDSKMTTKLQIEVHDDRQSKNTFMGSILIPLASIAEDPTKPSEIDRWFKLKRKPAKSEDPNRSLPQIGQVKIDIQYKQEKLLPDSFYDPLFELFQDEHLFLMEFCAKVAGSPTVKKEIIKSLVGAFEIRNRGPWLLKTVSAAEVDETWDLSVLFRGNSIASSCLDTFMRTVGRQVLDSTLRPILRDLYASGKSCELDPTRVPKGTDLKKNLSFFLDTLNWIWSSIQNNIDKMPSTMRIVLAHLRSRVTMKWPHDANSKYTSVTSFLFLRFFCPALMSPQSFDLVDEVPNALLSRNLALLSKTLMNLANFIPYGHKEPNLSQLNDWLTSNFGQMRDYIDRLVDDPEGSDAPIIHANATLFNYAREMNNLREFLTQKRERLLMEKDVVTNLQRKLEAELQVTLQKPNEADDALSSNSRHAALDKHHNSDDEDDVVEDLTTGRKLTTRKSSFKRVSSKSRLADSGRVQSGGVVLGKDSVSNPVKLRAFLELLERTLVILDGLNSSVETHQPSVVSPRRSPVRPALTNSSPSFPIPSSSATPSSGVKLAPPASAKPAMLARSGSLESSPTLSRKRANTTKQN
jgi:hypothetical protein